MLFRSGLVGAVELRSKEGAVGARGMEAMKTAWSEGLMIRAAGDVLAMSPPLIITKEQIDLLFEKLTKILKTIS